MGRIFFFSLAIQRDSEQLTKVGSRTFETSELWNLVELKAQPNFSSEEERLKILNPHDVLAKASRLFIAEPENL